MTTTTTSPWWRLRHLRLPELGQFWEEVLRPRIEGFIIKRRRLDGTYPLYVRISPDVLTVSRLLMPFVCYFGLYQAVKDGSAKNVLVSVFLILALMATDIFDGLIARVIDRETTYGAWLDAGVDKVATISVLLCWWFSFPIAVPAAASWVRSLSFVAFTADVALLFIAVGEWVFNREPATDWSGKAKINCYGLAFIIGGLSLAAGTADMTSLSVVLAFVSVATLGVVLVFSRLSIRGHWHNLRGWQPV
jgi:phosphatidylglycerophosphate synthase